MSETSFIEMVCTANQGRSPVAELIAQNYLNSIDAKVFAARSSGTSVDAIKTGQVSDALKIQIINTAKQKGMYSRSELDYINKAIKDANTPVIDHYYNQVSNIFSDEEKGYRGEVLKKFNIEGRVKETQDQTIVLPDTLVIFAMDQRNKGKVEEIYSGTNEKPLIEVITVFATDDANTEVSSVFGQGQKEYESCIASLVETVPKAIDRLLSR